MANVTPVASAAICFTLGCLGAGGGVEDTRAVLNVAVTVALAFNVTAQAPVPLQAPLQPAKIEPEAAAAVSANWVPTTTVSVQSAPHAIPAGELVTVPVPVPFLVTVSVTGAGGGGTDAGVVLKVAVTVVPAFNVTAQVPVPLQAPLQPAKVEPDAAAAVSVNWVPTATVSVQSAPHAIPAGELVTVPVPVPFLVTVSVTGTGAAVAEPLTPRETVSPPTVKFTLPAKLPTVVGANRTVTV